jgi:hypothetical protein
VPLQNRVTPEGEIIAHSAYGTLMGNRGGQLHDNKKRLTNRRWASKAWISCVLVFEGRRSSIMAPGHYTQLFFLDEATALAAGHRPCALCRRADFNRFMDIWRDINGLAERPKVEDVDDVLHGQRVTRDREKVVEQTVLGDLPPGTMFRGPEGPLLITQGEPLLWTPDCYVRAISVPDRYDLVDVLTPVAIVRLLQAGYAPALHDSALSMSATRSE